MMFDLIPALATSELNTFCRQNGIHSLSLFGSLLHGNSKLGSDIDLLVEFEPDRRVGLFDISRMELELTDLLGRSVDLRTAQELSKYFRDQVISEAQILYTA